MMNIEIGFEEPELGDGDLDVSHQDVSEKLGPACLDAQLTTHVFFFEGGGK